jgi:hypothetical protein
MNQKQKIAPLKNGSPQYEVARETGISETRPSRLIRGPVGPTKGDTRSFEWSLLTAIIHRRSVKEALEWGVQSDDFGVTEARTVFDVLVSLETDPANPGLPSVETFRCFCPNFTAVDDPNKEIASLCEQLRRERIERDAKAVAEQLTTDVVGNPAAAIARAAAALQSLAALGRGAGRTPA